MRKIKKINEFLIVKFNDRELREWDGTALGNYGVIDAELYTGSLDVDRSVMEYDGAETLEEAIEQARGLDAEEDLTDEEPTYTLVTETDEETCEEEIEPQLMIAGFQRRLEVEVKSIHHKDVDPRTAAHELYGYKAALNDLGVLEDEDTFVLPDTFGGWEYPTPLPKGPEELLAHICDEVCKERIPGRTQDELDAVCAKCAVERLADEADERELRIRSAAQREMNGLIHELQHESQFQERRISAAEARVYLRALVTTHTVTEREGASFAAAINEATTPKDAPPEAWAKLKAEVEEKVSEDCRELAQRREQFEHLDPKIKSDFFNRKLYALGLVLANECPDNDCRLYLNVFNMARELDSAIDGVEGFAVWTLETKLLSLYQELREMYRENYAVQKFKEGMKA
ncbi:MAG: hypothetical protein EOM52_02300 [Clostridia bacterium]|nr:hypothetical protein [Clostridia bacterium]